MSNLTVTQSDIKKTLDIVTLEKQQEVGSLKENVFNPLNIGFGLIGAYNTCKNNMGIYLSRCDNLGSRRSLTKLMEIDNAYLNKMCKSKNLAIATRAQLLKGQIEIAKRSGMTAQVAENCLKEFQQLSKEYYKKGLGKIAIKAPGLHRTWKAHGGKAMVVMALAMDLLTNIPQAFKHSTEAGIKQVGKSLGKSVLSAGGWVAGAAAGAAIGSVIPGAGTIIGGTIGAIMGFLGGSLGMFAADKLSEATGLSESVAIELNNEKQMKENKKIAASLHKGDSSYTQMFTENINNWISANILDENGNVKQDLPEDIKKEYEQVMRTASSLGLTAA